MAKRTRKSSTDGFLDSAQFKFNSGYHDGAADRVQGRPARDVSGHCWKDYAVGYTRGYRDADDETYTGNSSAQWVAYSLLSGE